MVIVDRNNVGIKLFAFCRINFKHLSKSELKKHFISGYIIYNNVRTNGHEDEAKRVKEGDAIELDASNRNEMDIIRDLSTFVGPYSIFYHNENFAVIEKNSGVSCGIDRPFNKLLQSQLWPSSCSTPVEFLYRPEKGLSGVCIVSKSGLPLQSLVRMVCERTLVITYRCIICGQLKTSDTSTSSDIVPISWSQGVDLTVDVRVLSVTPCRSQGFLSLIEFDVPSPSHASALSESTSLDDCSGIQSTLTKSIKSIRRVFSRQGHPIVGDQKLVKQSKGIFATIISITFLAPAPLVIAEEQVDAAYPLVISMPQPPKFAKLIEREERFYHLDQVKQQQLLTDYNLQQEPIIDGDDSVADESSSDSVSDCPSSAAGSDPDALAVPTASYNDGILVGTDNTMPMEYRINQAVFCGLRFYVDSSVMIPRRSSQVLVEEALRLLQPSPLSPTDVDSEAVGMSSSVCRRGMRVLDLGTGSGCLLLSILDGYLKHYSARDEGCGIRGVGVDISPEALAVASRNATALNLDRYCHFQVGNFQDLTSLCSHNDSDVDSDSSASYDVIMCNPPYSSVSEKHRLSTSRRQHEPALAIYANCQATITSIRDPSTASSDSQSPLSFDPLCCYRYVAKSIQCCIHPYTITSSAPTPTSLPPLLKPGGFLVLEVGQGQEKAVRAVFDKYAPCMRYVHSLKDHRGMIRCVVYRRI